jgi:hypothetical protein
MLAASTPNPSNLGQRVTFSAAVVPSLVGTPTPTGFVTFRDDGKILAAVKLENGKSNFSTSSLPAGKNKITVTYSGDSSFAPNTAPPGTQTVRRP